MAERRPRGFAAMDREQQRAIARLGGRAAHEKGTAHEFTSQEAAEAGRKGGRAAHAKGTAHKWTPEEATAAGRKGGQAHARRPQDITAPSAPAPELPPEAGHAQAGARPNGEMDLELGTPNEAEHYAVGAM